MTTVDSLFLLQDHMRPRILQLRCPCATSARLQGGRQQSRAGMFRLFPPREIFYAFYMRSCPHHFILFMTYKWTQRARVFVLGRPFQALCNVTINLLCVLYQGVIFPSLRFSSSLTNWLECLYLANISSLV